MADGPNHELNFQNGILHPGSSLDEIVRYLRFNKAAPDDLRFPLYQQYLFLYLPKLADPLYKTQFDEFIGDLADGPQKDELLARVTPAVDPVVDATVTEPVVKIELTKEEKKALRDAKKAAKALKVTKDSTPL